MTIELPDLPYRTDALEPFLSRETLETHHGKHHQGYVNKLNKGIEGTAYAGQPLNEIVLQSHANGDRSIFNNAAQVLNHNVLWESMSPEGGGRPTGPLGDAIDAAFGDFTAFSKAFKDAALGHFGSGWVWLVREDASTLKIVDTHDAETPIVQGLQPLLTVDVWEHAYYLDYKNDRGRYLDAFLGDCANWAYAARRLEELSAAA